MQTTAQVILVVDDDLDLLHEVGTSLTRRGYFTLTASGAFEALEKSRHYVGHIALLLADANVPELDDSMLVEHIIGERPSTRILLMSAGASAQPHFPLLPKPFRMAQMLEQVSTAIAGPPPRPALARAPECLANHSTETALQAEVNEMLRRYLESSRNFLAVTRNVPSGIPNPDGLVRLQQSANSSQRAFDDYRRAQKKLAEHRTGRPRRAAPEPEH